MPAKSWGIIYCPKEGSKRTAKRWKKMHRYIDEIGVTYDFVQSEGAGSVERLASMMTRTGYSTIVIVGGDSALNHAICGIMSSESPTGTHPSLGIIPNGFGNDFAKYWGLSFDNYREAINALICHNTRKVDVGVVTITTTQEKKETLYFLNCVNLGIASSITNLRRKTSSLFGFKGISYLISALLLLFQRMNYKFAFNMSGEQVESNAMSICVGSAQGYGQTPSAVPYNGLLDITLVAKPAISQLFHGLWLLFTGRFLSHKGIRVWRTRHVAFSKLSKCLVSLDGRIVHHSIKALDISIKQEEIDFIIP